MIGAKPHMVVASLVVETTPGKIRSAAALMSKMLDVTVHNFEGYKIVITIEASNIDDSHEVADSLMEIDGVVDVNVVYEEIIDDMLDDEY